MQAMPRPPDERRESPGDSMNKVSKPPRMGQAENERDGEKRMSEGKTVQEARATYDGLIAERKAILEQLEAAKEKLNLKLQGAAMPEPLRELRAEADRLEERRLELPDLIVDARDDLLAALEEERANLGSLLEGAKLAALDDLEAAFDDFSKAKDTLEKKIKANKNIQTFLEPLPNKDDQLVFDTILSRSFKNWGEPAGTPISAKVKRQLAERMGEVGMLFMMQKGNEIDSLRAAK